MFAPSSVRDTALCEDHDVILLQQKFLPFSTHLHRCKIENVPAPRIEEVIVNRMKDLSEDKELVRE